MAVTFSNIVTGEAVLSVGTTVGNVVDVGATEDGCEIGWEPSMVDIEIDQFGDAARVIVSKIKVTVKTKLAEATLENLALAWNYDATTKVVSGAGIKTLSVGLASVYPVEKVIKVVGYAPGSSATVTKTRTYQCTRAISYTSSSHTMKRSENVAYPVEFRILPDSSQTGKEYGTIVDVFP